MLYISEWPNLIYQHSYNTISLIGLGTENLGGKRPSLVIEVKL